MHIKAPKVYGGVFQFQNNASVPSSGTNSYLIGTPYTREADVVVTVPSGAMYLILCVASSDTESGVLVVESEADITSTRLGNFYPSNNLWSNNPSDWAQGDYNNSAMYQAHIKTAFPVISGRITFISDLATIPSAWLTPGRLQFRLLNDNDELVATQSRTFYNGMYFVDLKTTYPTATKFYISITTGVGSEWATPDRVVKLRLYIGYERLGSIATTIAPDIPHDTVHFSRELVDGGYIPTYWEAYMRNKKETLDDKDAAIGAHGFSFAFITDQHWSSNFQKSPRLLRWLKEHTNLRRIVGGGDVLNNYNTVSEAMYWLNGWRDSTNGLDVRNIRGNHDNNSVNTQSSVFIGDGRFYASMIRPVEEQVAIEDGHTYYYEKIEAQKVCIFYLDTGDLGSTPIVDFDAQITWMGSVVSTLSPDWSILVIQHVFWDGETDGVPTRSAFGKKTQDYLDTVTNCNVIGIISGHTHYDYDITAEAGYKVICTTCDAAIGSVASERIEGTTTEQAFDVFHIDTANKVIYATRIGAGADRQFSYT